MWASARVGFGGERRGGQEEEKRMGRRKNISLHPAVGRGNERPVMLW